MRPWRSRRSIRCRPRSARSRAGAVRALRESPRLRRAPAARRRASMRRYPRATSRQRCGCLRFSKLPHLPRERDGPCRYSPIVATGAVDTAIAARRDAARESDTASSSARTTLAVLTAWALVIVVAHVLLERLQAGGANIRIQAAPLVGTFDLRVSGRLLASLTVGTVVVLGGPRLVERGRLARAAPHVGGGGGGVGGLARAGRRRAGLDEPARSAHRVPRRRRQRRIAGRLPLDVRRPHRRLQHPRPRPPAGDVAVALGPRPRGARGLGLGGGAVHRRRRGRRARRARRGARGRRRGDSASGDSLPCDRPRCDLDRARARTPSSWG